MLFVLLIAAITVDAQVEPNTDYDQFGQRITNFINYATDGYFARQRYPAVKMDFLLDSRYLVYPTSNASQGQSSRFVLFTFEHYLQVPHFNETHYNLAYPQDPDIMNPLKFLKNKIIETCMDALMDVNGTINCQVIAIDRVTVHQRQRRSSEQFQLDSGWWDEHARSRALKTSTGEVKIGVTVAAIRSHE